MAPIELSARADRAADAGSSGGTRSAAASSARKERRVVGRARRPRRSGNGHRGIARALHPRIWLPAAVAFALLGLAWQLVAVHNHYFLPTLGSIGQELLHHKIFFARNTLVTMQETGVGLGAAFVIAFSLAVVMCHVPVVERAVMPLVVVLNVTPVVAIAPGLVVAFGFGMTPKYIVTGTIVFFPILVNSLVGLRSVDPQALDLLRTLHASRWEILLRLRLPSSLPFLFAAARVCFPVSIVGAVVAEFAASGQQRGLGSIIETSAALGALAPIYAAIFLLALLGLALTVIVSVLEAKLLSWHASKQQRT
jgi:NitT/TauT family transport system permease protein